MSRCSPRPLSLRHSLIVVIWAYLLLGVAGFPARVPATYAARATSAPAASALLGLNPPVIQSGGETVLSGLGFAPGEVVIVRFGDALQGSISADSGGSFGGFLLPIPAGTRAGNYVVSAVGATSGLVARATLGVQSTRSVVATAPGVALTPRTSVPGGRVQVSGAGFVPGETVLLAFNGGIVQRLSADAGGAFVSGAFVVPISTGAARYLVTAVGASSGRHASAVLAVSRATRPSSAHLAVARAFVAPRSRVSARGAGFAPGERVQVRVGATLVVAPVAGRLGTFSVTFVAPARLGDYTLTASGMGSGRRAVSRIQVVRPVQPRIALAASRTVRRGGMVAVSGTNYLPREIVLIRFHGVIVQATQANGVGSFGAARFAVPGGAPFGISPVTVEGARSGRLAIAFLRVWMPPRVLPRLTISTSLLHRGSVVTLSGSGFQPREAVLIRYRGAIVEAVQSDAHGAFRALRFTVPLDSPYSRGAITATGLTSGRRVALTVTVSPLHNVGLTVRPVAIARGGTISVSGRGFAAGEIVVLRLDGILVAAPTAGAHGAFSGVRVTVPRQVHPGAAVLDALGARSEHHAQAALRIG